MPAMHEVDHKIFGDDMQFVEVELDPGEAAVAEAGGMFYMEDVWLQSLPLSRMARRIVAAAPQTGRGGREEGSVLGALGDMLSGDR